MSYIDLDLIEPGRSVSGSVQAISVAASLASVGKGLAVNCGVESIAVSGLDALANSPRTVDALAASILSESQVSSVLTEVLDSFFDLDFIEPVPLVVDAATESIAVQGNVASLSAARTVNCAVEAVTVTANAATIGAGLSVNASAASVLAESQVSSVLTEVLDSFVDLDFPDPIPLVVDASTAGVAVSANTASLATSRTVSGSIEAISVSTGPATVGAGRLVSASAVSVLSESLVSAVLTEVLDSFVDLEFPDPIPLEVNASAEAIAVQAGVASLATVRNVDCAVELVGVTAAQATIGAGLSVAATPASVLAESLVSSVLTEVLDSYIDVTTPEPRIVDATAEGVGVSAYTASVSVGRVVGAVVEGVSVTASPVTIGAGLSVYAGAAQVVSESLVSSVLTESLDSFVDLDLAPPDSRTVDASLATIGVTGLVASVQMLRLVESSTEAVGVASGVASVSKGRAPTLSVVGVSVDAEQAGVVLSRTVDTGTESVSVTSLGAELGIVRNVDGSTASATVIAFPASIPKEVGASAAQIVVDVQVATVSTVEAGIPAGRAVVSLEAYRADVIYGNTPPAPRRVKPQPRRRVARIAARRVSRH